MYGNVGEKWVQVKHLDLGSMNLRCTGETFEIQDYHSFPHGYVAIKYEGVYLFIPDEIFENHFVKESEYKKYLTYGSIIHLNANGNLRAYEIDNIDGDDHYVTLSLKACD
ncbi:MAG: hypothetical protein LUH21_04730 [Clostridiales bacterium]|nr:hypothetical protein [Clostridiales bacterium]